jgi:hypothetical protein
MTDAYDLMNDAVFYRKGIGDDEQGDRQHQVLHQDVREASAGGRGGGVLRAGRDLREAR